MHTFYKTEQNWYPYRRKTMIHYFQNDISHIRIPEQFTFPFRYTPHPLCIMAAEEVQGYLQTRTEWHTELQQGKMFGVLVVRTSTGEIGYLAAFSGNLVGSNRHPFFVPPVYDLLNPSGYFKEEELRISLINRQLEDLLDSPYSPKAFEQKLKAIQEEAQAAIHAQKQAMKEAQEKRNKLRQSGTLTDEELELLNRQSQSDKSKLKRIKHAWQDYIEYQQNQAQPWMEKIQALKKERKKRSAALQRWIFQQFRMLNALGEEKDLCQLFEHTFHQFPPAGSGECAAPKLLQYAYQQGWQPIAMAEFWWGDSPKGEIRRHGHYYPACKHKCQPILEFMMQGLDVEPNPLLTCRADASQLTTVYEDEYLLVVNKPSGLLSVPGKNGQLSAEDILRSRYPELPHLKAAHRLDMDTSGLLLIAKDMDTYNYLQEQFENRIIKKRYIALLDGALTLLRNTGFIRLPLCPDYDNSPLQRVDAEHGKDAVTRYEILDDPVVFIDGKEHLCTRVAYYPTTGRTHQLRLHSAHPEGMDCPILGDPLYGQAADRMYLHAEQLEFRHPYTYETVRFTAKVPF